MYTAFDLKKRIVMASVEGHDVDPYELLDWREGDRLGVLIDQPVEALGAGLMILLAVSAFYDVPGKRRRQRPLYPEIYLFHVGRPWGVFMNFDFWPDHKEIFLPEDPREVLRAVDYRGITHLLMIDQPPASVEHRSEAPEAAMEWTGSENAGPKAPAVKRRMAAAAADDMKILENYYGVLEMDAFLERVAAGENSCFA